MLKRWLLHRRIDSASKSPDKLWQIFQGIGPSQIEFRYAILRKLADRAVTFREHWSVWINLPPECSLAIVILNKMIYLTSDPNVLSVVLQKAPPDSEAAEIIIARMQELRGNSVLSGQSQGST